MWLSNIHSTDCSQKLNENKGINVCLQGLLFASKRLSVSIFSEQILLNRASQMNSHYFYLSSMQINSGMLLNTSDCFFPTPLRLIIITARSRSLQKQEGVNPRIETCMSAMTWWEKGMEPVWLLLKGFGHKMEASEVQNNIKLRFHQNYPEQFVPETFFPPDLLLSAFPSESKVPRWRMTAWDV